MTCDEFLAGGNKEPILLTITEDYRPSFAESKITLESKDPNVVALNTANLKIKELQEQIAGFEAAGGNSNV